VRCEVCGRKIRENPQRVVIEGAKLTTCVECSKHGKATWEEPRPAPAAAKPSATSYGAPMSGPIQIRKRTLVARVDTSQEVADDYAEVIKQAREKMGWTVEELGLKISEKESMLRKVELGKMVPTEQVIAKLEHALKIKLLVPVVEEKVSAPKAASREFTLGDVIIDKKKKGE
jgi:putative transcription factor